MYVMYVYKTTSRFTSAPKYKLIKYIYKLINKFIN